MSRPTAAEFNRLIFEKSPMFLIWPGPSKRPMPPEEFGSMHSQPLPARTTWGAIRPSPAANSSCHWFGVMERAGYGRP